MFRFSLWIGRSSGTIASALLVAMLISSTTGCVEKGLYTQALADVAFARSQAVDANDKRKAAEAEIASLKADIDARDAKLNELTASDADTKRKLEEINVLNNALAERLQKAGQSLDSLSNERGSLAQSLADTRRQLDDLKKQQAAADARAAEFQALMGRFQKLVDAGKLKVALRDGRMMIQLPNDVLFDSGKADLKEEGQATLVEVAKVLATMSGRRFQVAGHTDNVRIATARFPSNWELSTARAVTVTRLLQDHGVAPSSLSAAGYGEFDPAAANDTPESRAKNRRIEISLVPNLDELVKVAGTASAPAAAVPAAPPASSKPGT